MGGPRQTRRRNRAVRPALAPESTQEIVTQDDLASEGEWKEGRRRTVLHSQLHKTKFCMHHLKGSCQYGIDCSFAHSCAELQATPDLRKTRLCMKFFKGAGCTDSKCPFAHDEEDLRSTDMFYRKTLCIWHEKGKCRNGNRCRFAHGASQLRNSPEDRCSKGQATAVSEQAIVDELQDLSDDFCVKDLKDWTSGFVRTTSSGEWSAASRSSAETGQGSVKPGMPMKVPAFGVLSGLPVNSPGGSSFSTDAPWEELEHLQEVWKQEEWLYSWRANQQDVAGMLGVEMMEHMSGTTFSQAHSDDFLFPPGPLAGWS